jgi:hypothetical protein
MIDRQPDAHDGAMIAELPEEKGEGGGMPGGMGGMGMGM